MTVEAGELVVRIVGNASGLRRDVERNVNSATQSVGKMGRSLGLAFGGAAIVGGITKTLNLAKNFDLTMRQVGVQTGQTGAGLAAMSKLALQMGKDTVYSAQDAAGAMLELAKGGLTSAQIKAGALKTSMTLAAAGGLELADASRAVVNGMGAFGLKAGQASRVATALAGAANASSADVSDMTQALAQASAQANSTGLSIEETSAALAIFANNGVKGSDAGTSLKTMLQNLIPTTVTQQTTMQELGLSFVKANGHFVSLATMAGRLREKLGGLTQAQRAQTLRTLFGSDASRAALFLYRAGAKGVQEATKATSDQTIVQKMANATMQGASGAWENFTGTLETAAIRVGTKALPALTELLNWGSDAVNNADQWGPKLQGVFDGVTGAAQALWPVIKVGAGIVLALAKGFAALPAPLQSMVVQAGLAALVLPRLTGAVTSVTGAVTLNAARLQQWRAELTYSATRAQAVSAAMQRLGAAARTAAGIGGMLLLAHSTQEASGGMKFLESTASGALIGLSMGGAPGAAIGTAAGAMVGLARATSGSAVEMVHAKDTTKAYIDTLDELTGAATRATHARVLDRLQADKRTAGLLAGANTAGVSTRDVVSATLGDASSITRIRSALQGVRKELRGMTYEQQESDRGRALAKQEYDIGNLLVALRGETAVERQNARAVRERALSIEHLSKVYKGVPRDVVSRIRTLGGDVSMRELRKLARQVDLTPKQVRIIARANNLDLTKRQVQRLSEALNNTAPAGRNAKRSLESVGKANGAPNKWQRDLGAGVTAGQRRANRGSVGIIRELQKVGNAKADLGPFTASVTSGAAAARGAARTGGVSVGAGLQSGMLAGFAGTAAAMANAAASAVHAAVAAAKAAGAIKSPSRVMRDQVGKQLGAGIAHGLTDSQKQVIAAAKATVDKVRDQYKSLVQDARQYGKDLSSGLVDSANITAGALQPQATTTASAVLAQFKARAAAEDAFTNNLGSLRNKLPAALLDQLRDAGVEQGGATAAALAAGSPGELRQIRQIQKQLAADAKQYAHGVTQDKYGDRIAETRGKLQRAEKIYDNSRHVNNIKVDVHNPVPEKASVTVPNKLRRLAATGALNG